MLDTPGCFSLTSDLLEPACVLLLVVNVSSCFRKSQGQALEEQLEAAGAWLWSRTVVVFSHGDWLGPTSIERRIESEGEALRRLVDKCGNRYHVLDNKQRGHGAQVEELMELVEQMLVEDRPDAAGAAAEPQTEKSPGSGRRQLAQTSQSDVHTSHVPPEVSGPFGLLTVAEGSSSTLMVPLGAVGSAGLSSREDVTPCLACVPSGHRRRPRWILNVPVCVSAHDLHLRTNGESLLDLLSPRCPRMLPALPPTQLRASPEGSLRRLGRPGGLQALMERREHSDLEELEAFIDLHFERVWEQSLSSPELEEQPDVKTGDEEALSAINRKLSKLELLEEIQEE